MQPYNKKKTQSHRPSGPFWVVDGFLGFSDYSYLVDRNSSYDSAADTRMLIAVPVRR